MATTTDDGHGSDRPVPLDGLTRADRRRPGRLTYTNPALIALLRGKSPAPPEPAPERSETSGLEGSDDVRAACRDDLAAARGLGFSVVVGFILWALILLAIRAVWLA